MEKTTSEIMVSKKLRAFEVVMGILAILLSFIVLVYPDVALLSLIWLLIFALIIVGVRRIVSGLMGKKHQKWLNISRVGIGILALFLAFVALVVPGLAEQSLILLLAFGLVLFGISDVFTGIYSKKIKKWVRGLYVVFGLVTFCFSIAVIIYPVFGLILLIYLVAVSLIFIGIRNVVSGMANPLISK
ncbi:MAG: DUF308 domain-containing protein [Candidatus Thermoplasmatota archaeon]|nr:DUF308 domain-containing protein [Candidatus Thermoplasmatota archaeon]MBU1940581.1 DUF308 domain-containing protein [Candidatus Thermoplasmatota archaeon]